MSLLFHLLDLHTFSSFLKSQSLTHLQRIKTTTKTSHLNSLILHSVLFVIIVSTPPSLYSLFSASPPLRPLNFPHRQSSQTWQQNQIITFSLMGFSGVRKEEAQRSRLNTYKQGFCILKMCIFFYTPGLRFVMMFSEIGFAGKLIFYDHCL